MAGWEFRSKPEVPAKNDVELVPFVTFSLKNAGQKNNLFQHDGVALNFIHFLSHGVLFHQSYDRETVYTLSPPRVMA